MTSAAPASLAAPRTCRNGWFADISQPRYRWEMNFATKRLTAEKLDPAHLSELTALHLDSEVCRFLGGVRSPEATSAYLNVNLAHWADHGFGLWIVRATDGAFAGRVGSLLATEQPFRTAAEGGLRTLVAFPEPALWRVAKKPLSRP